MVATAVTVVDVNVHVAVNLDAVDDGVGVVGIMLLVGWVCWPG